MGASQCICCDSVAGQTVDNISDATQLQAIDIESQPVKRARPSLKGSSLGSDDALASDEKPLECVRKAKRIVTFDAGEAKLEICFYKEEGGRSASKERAMLAVPPPKPPAGIRLSQEQRHHPLFRNVTFAQLRKCSGLAGAALTECWSELGPAYVKEEEVRVFFLKAPLGVEFSDEFPMKVKSVTRGSFADAQGLKVGWEVKSIAGKVLASNLDLEEQECERHALSSMQTQAHYEPENSAASTTQNSCGSIGVEELMRRIQAKAAQEIEDFKQNGHVKVAEPTGFSASNVPSRRLPDLWNLKEAMDFFALELAKLPRDDVKASLRSSLDRL